MMGKHDFPGDRQAQACALILPGLPGGIAPVEAIKDMRQHFGWDPLSAVGDI
jgi:hypothetical protein